MIGTHLGSIHLGWTGLGFRRNVIGLCLFVIVIVIVNVISSAIGGSVGGGGSGCGTCGWACGSSTGITKGSWTRYNAISRANRYFGCGQFWCGRFTRRSLRLPSTGVGVGVSNAIYTRTNATQTFGVASIATSIVDCCICACICILFVHVHVYVRIGVRVEASARGCVLILSLSGYLAIDIVCLPVIGLGIVSVIVSVAVTSDRGPCSGSRSRCGGGGCQFGLRRSRRGGGCNLCWVISS